MEREVPRNQSLSSINLVGARRREVERPPGLGAGREREISAHRFLPGHHVLKKAPKKNTKKTKK